MGKPTWCVSVVAANPRNDCAALMSYKLLVNSIKKVRNPNIDFFLLLYDGAGDETHSYSYEFVSITQDRVERLIQKVKDNFYRTPGLLTQFFTDFSVKSKAEHHFLLTHGHGAGFGFFQDNAIKQLAEGLFGPKFLEEDSQHRLQLLTDAATAYMQLFSSGVTLPLDGASRARFFAESLETVFPHFSINKEAALQIIEDTLKLFPVQTMADCLNDSFGAAAIKIKFMYSMNCYMQGFECGSMLTETVEYYMASENFQFFLGPDYDSLFAALTTIESGQPPAMDFLAERIIKDWEQKYKDERVQDLLVAMGGTRGDLPTDIQHVYLSTNILAAYPQIQTEIDELGDYFVQNLDTLFPTIRGVLSRCLDVQLGGSGMIDLKNFCKLLEQEEIDEALKSRLRGIIQKLAVPGPLIVRERRTESLCTPATVDNPAMCPNGLSLFFPRNLHDSSTNPIVSLFLDKIYRPSAAKPGTPMKNNWAQFVVNYFDRDPSGT